MRALVKPGVALSVAGALAVFGVVAVGVAVGEAGGQGPGPSPAGMGSVVASVTPPCPTEACMALVVKSGGTCADAACTVPSGAKFTLAVEIEVAPAGGYIGVQTWVDFGNDLTYIRAPTTADEIVWPDCSAVVVGVPKSTAAAHACITALVNPPPSTYVGNIVELSFTCSPGPSSTELRLVPLNESPADSGGTAFGLPFADPVPDPVVPSEVVVPSVRNLTVHCTAPVATPVGTPPATPASSATPMPTGGTPATPTFTPTGTPTTPTFAPTGTPATPTSTPPGTPAMPTFTTTGTPGATPAHGATATPVSPAATPTATSEPTLAPTPPVTLVGDANCDVNVNPIDAAFILQWSARLRAALPCPANADASGNGRVDPLDAALILQFSSGLIETLPP